MKRLSLFVLLALVTGSFGLFAQGKLEIIGGTTYDWGTVSFKETPLKAKVELKNIGNEELLITDVHPGCGCTAAKPEKDKLSPGESTFVNITLNVSANGQVTKSLTISTKSAKEETATNTIMYLKANVERAIQFAPSQYFVFNDMEVGKEYTAKLTLKNTSKQDVTFSDFTATNGVTLNHNKPVVVKAGGETELEAKVVPGKVVDYFSTQVSLKSTHPDFPTIDIQGYGKVIPAKQSKVFEASPTTK